MAIESLTLVRRRIGDTLKDNTESFLVADDASYTLQFNNVSLYNIYIDGTALETSEYELEPETGVLVLGEGVGNPDETIVVSYGYVAFTDDDLNELITTYGVNGACIEAIRWLLADAAKLHDYSRGATNESLSQVYKHLQELLKELQSLGGVNDPTNEGEAPDQQVQVAKRTNQYYRGRPPVQFDLSRDDSLSQNH